MANFYEDNEDLQYYFDKGIDWAPIVELTEFGYRTPEGFKDPTEAAELYRDVARMVGELAANEIAPYAAEIDREGTIFENGETTFPPRLAEIFEKIRDLDLHGLPVPRELGGMNAPMLLYFLTGELFARADVSTMAHHSFHAGIAMALLWYSALEGTTEFDREAGRISKTRFEKELGEIVRGEAWGSMDITEPDAGSDMAKLRTVAEEDENGNWTVTGEKIFITSGHGKFHFVIARTEAITDESDPMSGLSGLSMFLVPAYEDDENGNRRRFATVERVEEKLGHHGSVTAAVTFDRSPAKLVGERGEGFKYMLALMNNARLGVGFESIGLCEAAYRLARDYASERRSMGKTIDRHEIIADYLDEMRTDIQGLRALAVSGGVHQELAEKQEMMLHFVPPENELERARAEREMERHRRKARRILPLLKYLAAEKGVEMSRRALQIHGGNGYMKEFGAEKVLRDALVMPIYEGTSQIQALMAMKDTLGGILKNPRDFATRLAQATWRSYSSRDSLERRVSKLEALSLGAQQFLLRKTAADKVRSLQTRPFTEWPKAFLKNWDPKRDFSFALLHAERLTVILADEAIARALLDQALRHPERREVLERHLERAETRCRFLVEEITTTGARLLADLSRGETDLTSEAEVA